MSRPPAGEAEQPIAKIRWVPREDLHANSWNPNRQAPPERRLLKISLLENGWTQPLVVRLIDGLLEIVDGYHRWKIAENRDVAALTGGLVPVVELPECDPVLARLATIRHNRARGTHYVLKMADLVAELTELGMAPDEIGRRLQMDDEEVDRLADRGQMTKRGSRDEFTNAWTV